jgi:hypothetical protein
VNIFEMAEPSLSVPGSSVKKRNRFRCPYCRERFFTSEFRDSHAISWCKKRPMTADSQSSERDEQVDPITMEHVVKNLNEYITHQTATGDLSRTSQDHRIKFSCQYCHEQFFSKKYCDRHVLTCSHHSLASTTSIAPSAPLALLQTPTAKSTQKHYSTPNSGELRELAISLTKQLLSVHSTHSTPMKKGQPHSEPSVGVRGTAEGGVVFACPELSCGKKQFKSELGLKSHLRDFHRAHYQPGHPLTHSHDRHLSL